MPSLNRNIGIGGLDQGLCLIVEGGGPQLFDIDTNEFGLKQATLRFASFEPYVYKPKRGTPCSEFISGNAMTTAVLQALPFLAAQSSRVMFNGAGEGVHMIEVLCQGAIFDDVAGLRRVFQIPVLNHGSGYTTNPAVAFAGGDVVVPATAVAHLEAETVGIANGGIHHFPGDLITLSGGTFVAPIQLLVEDTDSPTGTITAVSIPETAHGEYSIVPSNPVTGTGPRGGTATFNIIWRLSVIRVTDGGQYIGLPTVSLSGGGNPNPPGILGACIMKGDPGIERITRPINPVSTVKETVQFNVYKAAVPGGTTIHLVKAATNSLPAYTHGIYSGYDIIFGNTDGALPEIDGLTMSTGMRLLLLDGTPYAGVYAVIWPGTLTDHWILARVQELDESSQYSNTVYVQVADGDINSGKWHCTVLGGFVLNTDPLTFEFLPGDQPAVYIPEYLVTIDYRAIELHWEYVTEFRRTAPRFLRDQYVFNQWFEIIANPFTEETFDLLLDSVTAEDPNVAQLTGGIVSGHVKITPYKWLQWIKFIGVGAQFEQIEAGQFHHAIETGTIKIIGAPPIGNIITA